MSVFIMKLLVLYLVE